MDKRGSKTNETLDKIKNAAENEVVEAVLETSELVLKRITDGIYREPSSALRELISNAYDADATKVEIQTDPPRFDSIFVRDNGTGLTEAALSHLIHNIGGSPKRRKGGAQFGVCRDGDENRSPGGRKLIGKIGIGLFSVSQLTKEFQIITKVKGTNHRMIADVIFGTHSEDDLNNPDQEFRTGMVNIWKVPAVDKDSHGTEIILRNLWPKTREDLSSKEIWSQDAESRFPPSYYIGCVHEDSPDLIDIEPRLPWNYEDSPKECFEKLVQAVFDGQRKRKKQGKRKKPSLAEFFDYYLQMLWTLSLSLPLDYMDKHPFDLRETDGIRFFKLGNELDSRAEEIMLGSGRSIRDELGLASPERGESREFNVMIDGVQLSRPLRFRDLPKTSEAMPYPLLFIGKDKPDLSPIPREIRGGGLEFEAYFLWSHTIVPKEHAGVLLRINDSSGMLFDETFMKYLVSEPMRKRQVTAEIFVTRGLDAALNIDRESFNYAHPHYLYLSKWVHNAFRQLANRQKAIASKIRLKNKCTKSVQQHHGKFETGSAERIRRTVLEDGPFLQVEFVDDEQQESENQRVLAFKKNKIFKDRILPSGKGEKIRQTEEHFETQIKTVAKTLDVLGVFKEMPYGRQEQLLREIVNIFSH